MVGFITARLTRLAESDMLDRRLMGLSGSALDSQHAVYILTLGTLPAWRHQVSYISAAGFVLDLLKSGLDCRNVYIVVAYSGLSSHESRTL